MRRVLAAGNVMHPPMILDFGAGPRRGGSNNQQVKSFSEQLSSIRRTNVLIGAHGAGLMHVIFMHDHGVLLEIHPFYRRDYHFFFAARMVGATYMPLRAKYGDFISMKHSERCR